MSHSTPGPSEVAALEDALARERALVDAALALAGIGDRARVAEVAAAAAVPHLAPWCLIVAGDGRAPPHLGAAHHSPAALPHVQALVDGAYHCVVALAEAEEPGASQAIDAARIRACAVDPAQEAALLELGAGGIRALPIVKGGVLRGFAIAGGSTGGAAATESFRRFGALVERALAGASGDAPRAPELKQHDAIAIAMHNIRNPLNGIYMAAGELAKRVPPELAVYVDMVRKSARRLNRLVQDLGELAAVDGGRLVVERVTTDPTPCVREVAATFAEPAASRGVELRLELEEALPSLDLDPLRFVQVLSELVDNALKFGGGAAAGPVVIRAGRRDGALEVSVIDHGPGVAPADVGRVFERFWMANRVDRQGNGLGLAIAQALVEAHGGTLRLDPTPGGGTTAVARFPLASEGPA